MSLDREVINEIAAELAIDPAFVEKDWFSVQVLKSLAEYSHDEISTIFSGGTCLSKGYGLIKRFSEDLDFRCKYQKADTGNQQRKSRSSYRKSIIQTIHSIEPITLDESNVVMASNHFKFPLSYPQGLEEHTSLRPHLEIEFSFTQPRLEPQVQPIRSMVTTFMNEAPDTNILCISPLEIGADKLSALTWRILKRDRSAINDDPAMIRHLHDLCALSSTIQREVDLFKATALSSFEEDQKSGKRNTDNSFHESLKLTLSELQNDKEYEGEYSRFVDAMSYADDADNIDFHKAKDNLEGIIGMFE